MWLINARSMQLESFEGETPKYAILSHRWEDEEVAFKDMRKQRAQHGKGYRKIQACCKQALADGFEYAWVDTCCIDKSSSAELSEAINSMFRWYAKSAVCYAYLSDISDISSQDFTKSLWFTRGWTLQELLAPRKVDFFDGAWNSIGSKISLINAIKDRTRIPERALKRFEPADYCVAEKMYWAANRVTTRIEDRAYSLLGLFEINMPLLYGEAENAFTRLQREIMDSSDDVSIFLTDKLLDKRFGMLGTGPESFSFEKFIGSPINLRHAFTYTKHGVEITCCLHRYVFDIHLLGLAVDTTSDHYHAIYIFVQWNRFALKFQRVALDGYYYYVTQSSLGKNGFDYAGTHTISIGRLPIEKLSSESSFFVRLDDIPVRYTRISPGNFAVHVDNVNLDKLCVRKLIIDYQQRSHLTQCLMFKYDWIYMDDLWIFYFSLNIDKKPTVFKTIPKLEPDKYNNLIYGDCTPSGIYHLVSKDSISEKDVEESKNQHEKRVSIDEIDQTKHKEVMLFHMFLHGDPSFKISVHFVKLRGTDQSWRAFIDGPSKHCNDLPEGWLLPKDRMIEY